MGRNQEIFDRAVGGVLKQRRLSVDCEGNCVYRGPDNRRCAVGHLIEDDEAALALEQTTVSGWDAEQWALSGLSTELKPLLVALQDAHDDASTTSGGIPQFRKQAKKVATDFNLKWNFG